SRDWSSDVCSSDLEERHGIAQMQITTRSGGNTGFSKLHCKFSMYKLKQNQLYSIVPKSSIQRKVISPEECAAKLDTKQRRNKGRAILYFPLVHLIDKLAVEFSLAFKGVSAVKFKFLARFFQSLFNFRRHRIISLEPVHEE